MAKNHLRFEVEGNPQDVKDILKSVGWGYLQDNVVVPEAKVTELVVGETPVETKKPRAPRLTKAQKEALRVATEQKRDPEDLGNELPQEVITEPVQEATQEVITEPVQEATQEVITEPVQESELPKAETDLTPAKELMDMPEEEKPAAQPSEAMMVGELKGWCSRRAHMLGGDSPETIKKVMTEARALCYTFGESSEGSKSVKPELRQAVIDACVADWKPVDEFKEI